VPAVPLLDVSDVAGGNTSNLPTKFAVEQNYPNPFNPVTTISYDVPRTSHVKLEVYNVLGQSVTTLVNEPKAAGSYEVVWDGSSSGGHKVASGIYFYRFTADNNVIDTRKMMLLK
jgi:methionine-rich copper-binding protein CopC